MANIVLISFIHSLISPSYFEAHSEYHIILLIYHIILLIDGLVCIFKRKKTLLRIFWPCPLVFLNIYFPFQYLYFIYLGAWDLQPSMWDLLVVDIWDLIPWPGIKPRPCELGSHESSHWSAQWSPCRMILLTKGME